MANIKINTDASLQDARQIEQIVESIANCMEELDSVIKRNIPSEVQTNWSEQIKSNWEQYYNTSIPEAMDAMKLSAYNLKMAVEEAIAYSTER